MIIVLEITWFFLLFVLFVFVCFFLCGCISVVVALSYSTVGDDLQEVHKSPW